MKIHLQFGVVVTSPTSPPEIALFGDPDDWSVIGSPDLTKNKKLNQSLRFVNYEDDAKALLLSPSWKIIQMLSKHCIQVINGWVMSWIFNEFSGETV